MSTLTKIYERELEAEIKISKKVPEDKRVAKLQRWPREAGLTITLDESGNNFLQLVKVMASDYGLEPGDKRWDIKVEEGKVIANLVWNLVKEGEVRGSATARIEIPLTPVSEDTNEITYMAKLKYTVEIASDLVTAKATEGLPEFRIF